MRHVFSLKVFGALVIFLLGFNVAEAQSARVFFSVPPKQVEEGDRLTVDVRIQSISQSINAISGVLSFPGSLVDVAFISKEKSIINLWTREPKAVRGKIIFEGVVLNPGFQGESGLVLRITFEAKQAGTVFLNFTEGAVLANDGRGTNVLVTLDSTSFRIIPGIPPPNIAKTFPPQGQKLAALPVITEYSPLVLPQDGLYLKGKGEPSALTKIVFKDVSVKSIGERLIEFLQTKRRRLDDVLVNNDALGEFQYVSPKNLVAGVYNATPFLVDEDTNTEKPGFGVQLLVDDSKIVKALVVLINVLGLLIPIVALGVIIYFIPWYSFRRMRVIRKKLGLEEEELELSEHQLERQDKRLDKTSN
ncbi:MAG: cohesin domain-containing protein [Patescibacteria group bacterium]